MCFNELVEQHLLGVVAFVGDVTNGILAMQQQADRASLRCPSCLSGIGEEARTVLECIDPPPFPNPEADDHFFIS